MNHIQDKLFASKQWIVLEPRVFCRINQEASQTWTNIAWARFLLETKHQPQCFFHQRNSFIQIIGVYGRVPPFDTIEASDDVHGVDL